MSLTKNSKLVTNRFTKFRRIHNERVSTKIENISTQQKSPAEEYNNLPKNLHQGFQQQAR